MKSIVRTAGIAGTVLAALLCIAGCASEGVTVMNRGVFGEAAAIPVKDYQTLGMIFTTHVYPPNEQDKAADVFTYQALLKEAQKLGADAIINVAIDRRVQTMRKDMGGHYRLETWYGSALAVKYTNIVSVNVPINEPREPLSGNTASGKIKIRRNPL